MDKMSHLFAMCDHGVTYQNVDGWVSYAFVEQGDHLYIYFQGSYEKEDWFANFFFLPIGKKPYKDMDVTYKVHRGFLAAWKLVEDIVMQKITELDETGEHCKWQHITVVGYSHGGSLVFFATEAVWFYRPDLRKGGLKAYAFESPRVLSSWFVPSKIRERWENMIVIQTNNDIVTHCPPKLLRFCHAGTVLRIKGNPDLVEGHLPKCVKSHFPQVVYQALIDYEK